MRSGHCSNGDKGHARCRMASCSCPQHDEDTKARAAALVEPIAPDFDIVECRKCGEAWDAWHQANAGSFVFCEHPRRNAVPVEPGAVLAVLSEATADLSEAVTKTTDPIEALRLLHRLRAITTTLAEVDAHLVTTAYLYGEHGDVRIDGLPAAKVTRGRERKSWDSRGAAFAYVERKITDNAGVAPDPSDVAAWVLDVVGASYCKVTPLRAVGLDPSEFCTESPGRLGVQFME